MHLIHYHSETMIQYFKCFELFLCADETDGISICAFFFLSLSLSSSNRPITCSVDRSIGRLFTLSSVFSSLSWLELVTFCWANIKLKREFRKVSKALFSTPELHFKSIWFTSRLNVMFHIAAVIILLEVFVHETNTAR